MRSTLDDVKIWIDLHLNGIETIADIAAQFEVSEETLRKAFARTEGVPLSDYLRKKRVDVMKHLLTTTDLKCYAICQQVGITREDTGVKLFKRKTGMTMDEYRRSHSNVDRARGGGQIAIGPQSKIVNR